MRFKQIKLCDGFSEGCSNFADDSIDVLVGIDMWFLWKYCFKLAHKNYSLKGAVVVTLCQNKAEVNFQIDIDHHSSPTEQAS